MPQLLPKPEDWLPPDLLAEMEQDIGHRNELYVLGCQLAQKFRLKDYSEDECYSWLVEVSPLKLAYRARQFEYQLRRAVKFVYESFEPGRAAGPPSPDFAKALEGLAENVRESKIKDKRYVLALIQHAMNTGHNPVHASARQIAAIAGVKSYAKAAEAMNRMQASLCGGILTAVTFDGQFGHSRLWSLNTSWREGYIYTMHDIYVPLLSPEERFTEWVSAAPIGTEFTVTSVAHHLNVSRAVATKLLTSHTDQFFGGGNYKGDRKHRLPAKWWREQPKWSLADSGGKEADQPTSC
jgi:hypothetical protein